MVIIFTPIFKIIYWQIKMDVKRVFHTSKPVVGMVHLKPVPGSPFFQGDISEIRRCMIEDGSKPVDGGVDALLMENYGDFPYYPDNVPKHVVAFMTALAKEIKRLFDLPMGISVLRNDSLAAISIASAVSGEFIRVNIHIGARVTDQGIIEGRAFETLRLRKSLNYSVSILADVFVKHSFPIGEESFEDSFRDLVERGRADGIIVSGKATGEEVNMEELKKAIELRSRMKIKHPIFVGSGVNLKNVEKILDIADGVIVGTFFKEREITTNPVDANKVKEFMDKVRNLR
jgi:hypothetical protein